MQIEASTVYVGDYLQLQTTTRLESLVCFWCVSLSLLCFALIIVMRQLVVNWRYVSNIWFVFIYLYHLMNAYIYLFVIVNIYF